MPRAIATAMLTLQLAMAAAVGSSPSPAKEIANLWIGQASATAIIPPATNVEPKPYQAATRPLKQIVVFSLQSSRKAELRRSPDGLFYLDALVNDVPVRFLVDTGANAVVLNAGDAQRAGVRPGASQLGEVAQTAGGKVVMTRTRLRSLEAGPMRRNDFEVAVTDADLPVSLLGQSWLSQLGSVTIAGDRMVLE